eukprot:CFRG6930T1
MSFGLKYRSEQLWLRTLSIALIFSTNVAVATQTNFTGDPERMLCLQTSKQIVNCDGIEYTSQELDPSNSVGFYLCLFISIFLVLFAGLMSGLTIGLLSLDSTLLQVLRNVGSPKDRIYAARIIPIVEQKHWLLVSLLLCNSAAMEALPVFLGHIVPELLAVLLSVTAVLLFGEIIPQAICSKYGLAVGYHSATLVSFLMILCSPIAWPVSNALDWILGKDHGQFYRRDELKELVNLHGQSNRCGLNDDEQTPLIRETGYQRNMDESIVTMASTIHEALTYDEVSIIKAAIEMTSKVVKDAMTKLEAVLLVNVNRHISREWVAQLLEAGHSRVPVYEGNKENIVGFIMIRSLVLVDLDQDISLREIEKFRSFNVREDFKLYDMLNKFQTGKSHMAVVHDFEGNSIGIITLEDVIEELINEEIIDETDVYVDVERRIQVTRPS